MNNRYLYIFCFFALIVIHSIDMVLTEYYIGDDYQMESFPLMRWMIRYLGINYALWVSRFSFFGYISLFILNHDKQNWKYSLLVFTLFYYSGMLVWFPFLGIITLE